MWAPSGTLTSPRSLTASSLCAFWMLWTSSMLEPSSKMRMRHVIEDEDLRAIVAAAGGFEGLDLGEAVDAVRRHDVLAAEHGQRGG